MDQVKIICPNCKRQLKLDLATKKGEGVAWSGCEPTLFEYTEIVVCEVRLVKKG